MQSLNQAIVQTLATTSDAEELRQHDTPAEQLILNTQSPDPEVKSLVMEAEVTDSAEVTIANSAEVKVDLRAAHEFPVTNAAPTDVVNEAFYNCRIVGNPTITNGIGNAPGYKEAKINRSFAHSDISDGAIINNGCYNGHVLTGPIKLPGFP